ncbi:hypothetical protein KUTeg_019736 [Tegillarca granosa]|uniref:Uncharacterized protein n=1 Tax=Tegillarca granosa TaxID=220873 RepID=A0ABQ9EIK1_TEGGR|nr:hypothetical protein KUTeg_019736 [Tegillarca granosa]
MAFLSDTSHGYVPDGQVKENVHTLLVDELTQHLKCTYCSRLYEDPVINIRCGHTFCRKCAFAITHCNKDGNHIDTTQLVLNRSVVDQINDLHIHCQYGVIKENGEYTPDPTGCPEKITIGQRHKHEDQCTFIFVTCPNSEECGQFRKFELEQHFQSCAFMPCPNHIKGCEFKGKSEQISEHELSCGYRSVQQSTGLVESSVQIKLLDENKELKQTVRSLTDRVSKLEESNNTLRSQLEYCVRICVIRGVSELKTIALVKNASNMQAMGQKYESMQSSLEQMLMPRNRRSSGSPGNSAEGSGLRSRTNSSSSIRKSISGSPAATMIENWEMPFQFKCIGTLRGHQNIVWCLATYKNKVYSSGADSLIKVWDMEALAKGCIKTLQGHTGVVHCMAVGSDDLLYTGGDDLCIKVWNLDTYTELTSLQIWEAKTLTLKHTISGLHHWVRALAVSPSKDKIYSGSHNTIDIWDTTGTFNLKGKIDHQFGSVYSLAVTKQYLIVGTYNRNIQAFNINTYEHVSALRGHIGTVTALAASPSGRFLFSSSTDNTVKVFKHFQMQMGFALQT